MSAAAPDPSQGALGMTRHIPDPDETAPILGRISIAALRLLAGVADRAAGEAAKDDGSPASDADRASERLIVGALRELWPDIPVVAEESVADRGGADLFFLVDPLDGTRDYLAGSDEYSVNIALVSGARPIAAALAAPGRLWIAGRDARVAATGSDTPDTRLVQTRPTPPDGIVALVSRRHGDDATDACLATLPVAGRRSASSALKFGLIASGEADLYLRFGPTMEWDTAAGDHIVSVAGGLVVDATGRPMRYGEAGRRYLNGPFAAMGDAALAARIRFPSP